MYYVNIRKAFDTVNRTNFLNKLRILFNLDDTVIACISSFLYNRKQFCRSLDTSSSQQVNPIGVPQGSILGPIFFSLFINDCPNYVTYADMLLYVDDTALLMKEKHLGKLYSDMEHNLFLTDLWLRSNKLPSIVIKVCSQFLMYQDLWIKDSFHSKLIWGNTD